jgi:single-strand DNA-binding protein
MNNLNSIIIEGNLTRDPDFKETPKGTPVCVLSVASNRYYKVDNETKQEVSFFNVETWAKLAETCNQYLAKGRGVRVIGRLKQERWTTPDGQNRERVKIVAEHVEFKPQFRRSEDLAAEQNAENEIGPDTEGEFETEDQDLLEAV